jgi:hypothetical protein
VTTKSPKPAPLGKNQQNRFFVVRNRQNEAIRAETAETAFS